MNVPRHSSRIFVLDAEDRIYRLAGARFSAMLKRPDAVPLRRFVGIFFDLRVFIFANLF